MSPGVVRERADQINEIIRTQERTPEKLISQLWRDVLQSIRDGNPNARLMAFEALKADDNE
jgi:hypothetical protein